MAVLSILRLTRSSIVVWVSQGLTALQALTALTYLSFFDVLLSDNAMLKITKCQQLDRLELYVSNVSDAGMMHVTSMTALRSLSFIQWDNDHAPELHLDNKVILRL